MWDLPSPGIEPMTPALAGGFLTTEPPEKPILLFLLFKKSSGTTHQLLVTDLSSQFGIQSLLQFSPNLTPTGLILHSRPFSTPLPSVPSLCCLHLRPHPLFWMCLMFSHLQAFAWVVLPAVPDPYASIRPILFTSSNTSYWCASYQALSSPRHGGSATGTATAALP